MNEFVIGYLYTHTYTPTHTEAVVYTKEKIYHTNSKKWDTKENYQNCPKIEELGFSVQLWILSADRIASSADHIQTSGAA